ncbi:MAG: flagellar hook-associated protein FlgK [Desulfatirhabdiaceae bacterium]
MPGIMTGLYVGRDALMANQLAINVTGQNLANVNTPGYTRQRVNLQTSSVISTPVGTLGTGVNVSRIQRMVDRFTSGRMNQNIQEQGKWQAQKQTLDQVETVFTETEDYGLSHSMNIFWNAWQDVATHPSGYAQRVALTSAGTVMADNLNQARKSLMAIQQDTDAALQDGVSEINAIADKLNSLNQIIFDLTAQGQSPNDLLDQRDSLLNDLSNLIDFTIRETDDKIIVTLEDGKDLVGNSVTDKLTTTTDLITGLQNIVWASDTTTSINGHITSGQINGWLTVRDDRIPAYAQRLDNLAAGMIDAVNTLHNAGIDLEGTTGNDYFTGDSALNIQVNSNLIDNPNLIAAAGPTAGINQIAADNTQALAIVELQNADMMNTGTARFDEYYSATFSMIGGDVQTVSSSLNFQVDVVAQLKNYRESVSGVSLDEEMVNLIKFQHGFDAASRLVATVDEMMAELVNMVS